MSIPISLGSSVSKFQKASLSSTLKNRKSKLQEFNIQQIEYKLPEFESEIFNCMLFYKPKSHSSHLELKISLENKAKFSELIKLAISLIASKYLIPLDIDKYSIFIAKKNGDSKPDLPALDKEQFVRESGVLNFCLKLNISNSKNFESIRKDSSDTIFSNSDSKRSTYVQNIYDSKLIKPKRSWECNEPKNSRVSRFFSCFFCE